MAESSLSTPRWPQPSPLRCLVTGASGYIGGRLVPELLAAGYPVRCMAREPGKLADRPWSGDIEIAAADALERRGVQQALEDVDVAYYLIHSVGSWPAWASSRARCTCSRGLASRGIYRPPSRDSRPVIATGHRYRGAQSQTAAVHHLSRQGMVLSSSDSTRVRRQGPWPAGSCTGWRTFHRRPAGQLG